VARALRVALSLLAVLLLGALGAAGAQGAVQPFGSNDAGGFRNVLPPGENGLVNPIAFNALKTQGTLPPHFADQQALYQNLPYGLATLTDAQVPNYFKDATFGVPDGQVESTVSPRPGVTIVRDKAYGIPHVYGDSRSDTMFGAGYAGAQDRLFLMDVLRHTGRADLASFLGGNNASADASQWGFTPYTEADLQRQIDQMPRLHGSLGQQAVEDVNDYVAGINAYIAAIATDPLHRAPVEYTAFGKQIQPWKPTDVVAISSLIGGIFGRGGGNELASAQTMQAIVAKLGTKAGRKAWLGFRSKNDPEAPTTVKQSFPYETEDAFSAKGLALPDPGSVSTVSATAASARASTAPTPNAATTLGAAIRSSLVHGSPASNWELVSAKHSATGHPIAVMGPQVGYYDPQILMEEDLHGPGIDARGAAFPGINMFVNLGHGRDYAWSATTATSDNIDTFAEVLCQDDFHYMYRGTCRAMEKLQQTESWTPNAADQTPAGSQTLTAYRTVHGIVYARGKVHGQKVAFVHARSTYLHETESLIGFSELNDPQLVNGVDGFKAAVSDLNYLFNWGYVDANHIAYAMSGAMPQRAKGTSPDFPILGTGQYDWQGFNPDTQTATYLPFAKHPQVVDPPYLVSWNNKQAPGWAAADDKYTYGPLFRSQMIEDKVKAGTSGTRKMTISQLVKAMDGPATQDIRAVKLVPIILKAVGTPSDPQLKDAVAKLKFWHDHGGNRSDLNKDGADDSTPAIELMDAWWPRLLQAEFGSALGPKAFAALTGMVSTQSLEGSSPAAPSFSDGWYGYVSKDLRDLFGPKPKLDARWSRIYCGGGSQKRCRTALQQSLTAALKVTPQQIYGGGNGLCASNPQPSCFDQNRPKVTSVAPLPPYPIQNRPTFQQVVKLTRKLGR
jgi:acyl-homoserine lactone acylase PvdQ